MHPHKHHRRRLCTLIAFGIASATLSPMTEGVARAQCVEDGSAKLFVRYEVESDCRVYPNYDKPGVKGQMLGWTVEAGDAIIWRYNVNSTWAVVSDPRRAEHRRFPWWGFMRRDCIGKSTEQCNFPAGHAIPTRLRKGRSRVYQSGWRPVDYDQGPEHVVRHSVRVRHDATLRDRANFVVGNVFGGWRVDVTNLTRSNGHWVYVYSPSARKWGYVERRKLDL